MLIRNLKDLYRYIFYRPRFASVGKKSFVLMPRKSDGNHCIHLGNQVVIREHSRIFATTQYEGQIFKPEITIADNVYIGQYVNIQSINRIIIEEDCVLSDNIFISDIFHGMDPTAGNIMKQPLYTRGGVHIGKSTFIGLGSAILPGVTLGKHCIVGTHSVVTKSFPDYSMVAGNPAKLIKVYDLDLKEWITPNKK